MATSRRPTLCSYCGNEIDEDAFGYEGGLNVFWTQFDSYDDMPSAFANQSDWYCTWACMLAGPGNYSKDEAKRIDEEEPEGYYDEDGGNCVHCGKEFADKFHIAAVSTWHPTLVYYYFCNLECLKLGQRFFKETTDIFCGGADLDLFSYTPAASPETSEEEDEDDEDDDGDGDDSEEEGEDDDDMEMDNPDEYYSGFDWGIPLELRPEDSTNMKPLKEYGFTLAADA